MNYDYKKFESLETIEVYKNKMVTLLKDLQSKFEKLKIKTKDDLKDIDPTNLTKEQNRNISHYHYYITLFAEEKSSYNKMKNTLYEMEAQLNDYYRFNWDKSTKLSETAINKYVLAHPCYISLITYIKEIEVILDFIKDIIECFKNRNYAIKNMIDIRKIELGLM